MKRIRVLLIWIFTFSFSLFADDCSDFLSEGKQHYNNGNYQKANECFVYVKGECGESYGSVNDWIQLCDEKLNRTKTTQSASNYTSVYLSVSPISLNFSVKGGTKTISVSSSSGFNVSTNNYWIKYRKNDYSIDITIDENFNSSVRDGSIKITNYDGKSVSIAIRQQKKLTSAQLTSSPLYLEFEANGGTKALTITSSSSFSVETDVSWLTYSKSDDYVYVTAKANSYSVKRNGMIKIQNSEGKTISVSVSQKEKISATSSSSYSSSSSYLTTKGKIHKVWAEHNVMYGGQKCMKIHVKFEVEGMKGKSGDCVAWFYYSNGNKLYDTNNLYKSTEGQVAVSDDFNATYDNSLWNDFIIYIPNSELHIYKEGSYKFCVGVFDHNNKQLATSSYVTFTYGNSSVKKSDSYRNSSNLTAYQKYIQYQDNVEITWFGLNTSICTGYELGYSLFRLRFGWFQLKPFELTLGKDFLSNEEFFVAYNPSINFLIPTGYDGTFYFGGGPSLNTSYNYDLIWFNTELGYRWHWGDWASSDFFMRYDGAFTVGLSIQWSSYF